MGSPPSICGVEHVSLSILCDIKLGVPDSCYPIVRFAGIFESNPYLSVVGGSLMHTPHDNPELVCLPIAPLALCRFRISGPTESLQSGVVFAATFRYIDRTPRGSTEVTG